MSPLAWNFANLHTYEPTPLSATLTKAAEDFAWVLGSPRDLARDLTEGEIAAVVSLLVAHLPTVIDPKSFEKIIGAEELVDGFIDKWVGAMSARGLHLEALPTLFRSKVSYATLATIPPLPPMHPNYALESPTSDDLDSLAHLFIDFTTHGPHPVSLEEARIKMQMSIDLGEVWVCRAEGEIVGFCATGRATPKTMAIRNVYVPPKHRRKGIAEAMVKMLTRYLLGAEPLGFSGGLVAAGPSKNVKRELALNVAEDFAERLYRKCGFLLGEDDRDPASGKKGWFISAYRGVQLLDK